MQPFAPVQLKDFHQSTVMEIQEKNIILHCAYLPLYICEDEILGSEIQTCLQTW